MKRFIEGEDRSRVTLLPECLDDFIAEDNPVRVVDAFVEELDLQGLGFEGNGSVWVHCSSMRCIGFVLCAASGSQFADCRYQYRARWRRSIGQAARYLHLQAHWEHRERKPFLGRRLVLGSDFNKFEILCDGCQHHLHLQHR